MNIISSVIHHTYDKCEQIYIFHWYDQTLIL
jgi:hypothetical protein